VLFKNILLALAIYKGLSARSLHRLKQKNNNRQITINTRKFFSCL